MKKSLQTVKVWSAPLLCLLAAACGGGGSTGGSAVSVTVPDVPATGAAGASLMAGYKQAQWSSNITVTYPPAAS